MALGNKNTSQPICTAGEIMALGNSAERSINGRFIFCRSRGEWADLKHTQDFFSYLLRHYVVLIKTFLTAAENEPIMICLRTANQYQKMEIYLQTVAF